MPPLCTAKASYKKTPGLLELTDACLQWTPDGSKVPSLRVASSQALSLFCSKDGAAQVKLKLGLVGDDAGHYFTFTSPQPIAYTEREKFKKELTSIISRNRSALDSKGPITPIVAPITSAAASATSTPTKHAPTPAPSRPVASASRAVSVAASDRRAGTPIIPGHDAANDFRLRKVVLMSNPELLTLHRELVMSGQITEAEFWDGREHLLLSQAASEVQKKGKSGQLVDPRPETVEGGEVKIRITPQLVHDIFDEFPVVSKAYSENVPQKLSEEDFWRRYFQSKLFNAHRASIRSSAAQHVVKDDPIFDKYLEKEDDELEPRRQRTDIVDLLLDLKATQEDHEETGNENDVTMQAGRQRGALPLIRKFNEHSERLLNSALGEGPPAKKRKTDSTSYLYSQIDLDDLHGEESAAGILLNMKDSQRYFEGRTSSQSGEDQIKDSDIAAYFQGLKNELQDWTSNLTQLKIERKPGDAALMTMTQNVASRLEVKTRRNDIPEILLRQMTTCQTAANEFLRQFWSSMYPQADGQVVAVATPAQRATKAQKMVGYLAKTQEKVDALVNRAKMDGLDPEKVKTAMQPVLDSVDRALSFHKTRKVPRV